MTPSRIPRIVEPMIAIAAMMTVSNRPPTCPCVKRSPTSILSMLSGVSTRSQFISGVRSQESEDRGSTRRSFRWRGACRVMDSVADEDGLCDPLCRLHMPRQVARRQRTEPGDADAKQKVEQCRADQRLDATKRVRFYVLRLIGDLRDADRQREARVLRRADHLVDERRHDDT